MAKVIPISLQPPKSHCAEVAIELGQVHLHYDKKCVLHNLDMRLPTHSLTAILGPNGAGKTSLLKAIMGLLPLSSGYISIDQSQGKIMGYLPQTQEFDRDFPITLREMIEMGALGQNRKEKLCRVEAAINLVGLNGMANRMIADLSAGQLKRGLFARLWVQNADIICLDEPFADIDESSMPNFVVILKQWKDSGKTVIMVLHDQKMAMEHFDFALILNPNSGHQFGSIEQISKSLKQFSPTL